MRLPLSKTASIAAYLAHSEVRSRYARSVLGSFWVTIQQAIFVAVAGLVFPGVFGVPVADYVPFFAVSLLFWNFFAACILESQDALIANGPMVRDRGFSPEIFLLAVFFRNLLMTAHAIVIPIVVIAIFAATTPAGLVMALPGILCFLIVAACSTYILGILAVRFRDLKRVCESALQLGFLVTPILWRPEFAVGRSQIVVDVNPLAHLFIAWRKPLLEGEPAIASLFIAAGLAAFTLAVAAWMSRRVAGLAIWI